MLRVLRGDVASAEDLEAALSTQRAGLEGRENSVPSVDMEDSAAELGGADGEVHSAQSMRSGMQRVTVARKDSAEGETFKAV